MAFDGTWGLICETLDLELGTWVVVRSQGQGVSVGRLRAASGDTVGLTDCTHLHRWSGCGRGTGSVYDLIAHPEAKVERSEPVERIVIVGVSDVTPVSEERAIQLSNSPRA